MILTDRNGPGERINMLKSSQVTSHVNVSSSTLMMEIEEISENLVLN
jgi:hypothetical protein